MPQQPLLLDDQFGRGPVGFWGPGEGNALDQRLLKLLREPMDQQPPPRGAPRKRTRPLKFGEKLPPKFAEKLQLFRLEAQLQSIMQRLAMESARREGRGGWPQ